MLRRTFFLLAALFVVSACGPNCNLPYGGYQAGVYQQPGCPVYPAQYPTTGYPQTGYPQTGYPTTLPYPGYPQTGYPTYPQTGYPQPYPPTSYCAPGNPYCYHSEE